MKFRKKPVVIEAVQFTQEIQDRHEQLMTPLPKGVERAHAGDNAGEYYVVTIHGQETWIVPGDWIMPEPDGIHFYPCKDDIFRKTYEVACDHKGLDNQAVHWNPLNGVWQCHA